jgi:signal transduction histidine kinase
VGAVDLYPQEITRALLNLISNGFHAVTKRKVEGGDETFEPVLNAATRNLGKTIEIRIRDNGTGIQPEVKEKMFNPFFTTKPTGEGTGLGLSMTHDIIVKQHRSSARVSTTVLNHPTNWGLAPSQHHPRVRGECRMAVSKAVYCSPRATRTTGQGRASARRWNLAEGTPYGHHF